VGSAKEAFERELEKIHCRELQVAIEMQGMEQRLIQLGRQKRHLVEELMYLEKSHEEACG
jgi:hypothetical protein